MNIITFLAENVLIFLFLCQRNVLTVQTVTCMCISIKACICLKTAVNATVGPELNSVRWFHDDCFLSQTMTLRAYSSFEVLINKIGRKNPFYCVLVYRPPGRNSSFLAEFSDFLSSIIHLDRIIMASSYFKQAAVQPLLKKPSLDPFVPQNYRPISKFPFVSKLLEKVVANQLSSYLAANNIGDKFQSGFWKNHSTETALLKVTNDIMMASDSGKCSVQVLLDLSIFDTVDHHLLLGRLRDWVGVTGTALAWFASYLSDRYFSVAVGPYRSDSTPLHCGVPQGSVLAPLLLALCSPSVTSSVYSQASPITVMQTTFSSMYPSTLKICKISTSSWIVWQLSRVGWQTTSYNLTLKKQKS